MAHRCFAFIDKPGGHLNVRFREMNSEISTGEVGVFDFSLRELELQMVNGEFIELSLVCFSLLCGSQDL